MYSLMLATVLSTGNAVPAWDLSYHLSAGGIIGCNYSDYTRAGYYGTGYANFGCYGCGGGLIGPDWYRPGSPWGGYGGHGCYGAYAGYGACYGCLGSGGGSGCVGSVVPVPAIPTSNAVAPTPAPTPANPEKLPAPTEKPVKEASAANRALIYVQLPLDARLLVDYLPAMPDGGRPFVTPPLEQGKDYYYDFRAEIVRDGTPVALSKRVMVRAGSDVTVDLREVGSPIAKKEAAPPAHLTVRLPEKARLFVDGEAVTVQSGSRTFSIKALESGQDYCYVVRAEVEQGGQTRTVTRRVIVQAGQRTTVDFREPPTLAAADR